MLKQSESRGRYLAKNTAIFAIGNVASRLISFFLVPLYTNILTTAEYGVVDLVNTLCTVLAPILILNINEAVMRFALDNEYRVDGICWCDSFWYFGYTSFFLVFRGCSIFHLYLLLYCDFGWKPIIPMLFKR